MEQMSLDSAKEDLSRIQSRLANARLSYRQQRDDLDKRFKEEVMRLEYEESVYIDYISRIVSLTSVPEPMVLPSPCLDDQIGE